MSKKLICLFCFVLLLGLVGTNAAFGADINIRITDPNDDAEQHIGNGNMDITSTDLELAYEDAAAAEGKPATDEQVIGLRFVNVPLAKGAPVTNAYVEFEVDKVDKLGSANPVNLIIEGELTAAPFVNVKRNITDRTSLTTAKVKWSIPPWTAENEKFQTPDISSIIQEIINQDGWAKGNTLMLIFRDDKDNPSTGLREAESVEGESEAAPLLHLTTIITTAGRPNPADGTQNLAMDTTLSWLPGDTAATHDVYFGTSPDPSGAFVGNQAAASYNPGPLQSGTTYYWRIDEVEADGTTKHTGAVWSFTTAAVNIVINNRITNGNDDVEEHVANGSIELTSSDLELAYEDAGTPATDEQVIGLRFVNLVIPKGAKVTTAYVEFEVDSVSKAGSANPVNLIIEGELTAAPFTSAAKDITNRTSLTTAKVKWSIPPWTAVNAKFQTPDISSIIQEIINQDGWASGNALVLIFRDDKSNASTGLREAESVEGEAAAAPLLHIMAMSEFAMQPNPADGAEGVAMDTTLSWAPGLGATTHDVYFGPNSPPAFIGNQAETSYSPGPLELGTTYYWQISEVEADGVTKHAGDIWSFTVTSYRVVDDFESYEVTPVPPPAVQIEVVPGSTIVATAPDPAGLLIYWNLDGVGPQIIDDSGKGNMGFLIGAGRASPGYDGTGSCMQCRGSGDYALGANAAFFNGLSAMTTSVWVKSNATNTDSGFFHGEDPVGNDDRGMRYDAAGASGGGTNVIKIGATSTGGLQQLESSSGVQTTEWQHLAMTWSSGNQLALYINGRLNTPTYNDAAKSGTLTGYTKFIVGKGAKDDLATESWNGLVDDVRVYNYALSYGEVRSLARAGDLAIPPILGPLRAHYKFDGNTDDSSGNNYNGTPKGGPTYAPGVAGSAIDLDGVNDHVVVGSVGISGAAARTIAGWAKADAISMADWINIFGFTGPSGDNKHFDIEHVNVSGQRGYGIHVYGWERVIFPVNLEWHHLAASYDGTTIKWYGDGQLVGKDSTRVLATPDNVHMGKRFDNTNYFAGLVDDVRIYDYALTDAEVAGLAGFVPANALPGTWLDSGRLMADLETSIAHWGKQAMKLYYDNTVLPYQGEAGRIVPFADWNAGGAQALSLWLYGDPGNAAERMYVAMKDGAGVVGVVNNPNSAALTIAEWSRWEIPFSALAGAGVNLAAVEKLYIGLGRTVYLLPGGAGTIRIDDIRVIKPVVVLEPADVTAPGDDVKGVPNDGDWPAAETPPLAIDNNVNTKYLHFKGDFDPNAGPTGLQVTPSASQTIVTGLTFTTANDVPGRDPTAFALYGSNVSIAGPYTLIASGEIVDFKAATEWPRFTKNTTPISFDNAVAYDYYQLLFTAIRGPVGGSVNSMQIAEVELIGVSANR